MWTLHRRLVLAALLGLIAASLTVTGGHAIAAKTPVSGTEVANTIERFLLAHTRAESGAVSLNIGQLPASSFLEKCFRIDVSLNPGTRTAGRVSVAVRCTDGAAWKLQVPVYIKIASDFLVLSRSIGAGQAISADDISVQTGDLAELPAGVLSEPAQAIGQTARTTLQAGRPLRADQLKSPQVVRSGQVVTVMSGGTGFSVSNEGTAVNAAAVGELVKVRMANGQVVSGKASKDGRVVIGP